MQEARVLYRTHNQTVSLTDCIYSFVTKFGVMNVPETRHILLPGYCSSLVLL
jgi:hypothetical protein